MRLINSVLPSLGDDVVMVSVDVDVSESPEQLRRYADGEGWRWRHALGPRSYLNAAADRFGTGALNPPSDATLVIDTNGNVEAHFGSKNEQRIRDLVARARR